MNDTAALVFHYYSHIGQQCVGLSIVLMLFIIFNMVISVITDKEGEANTL